MVNGHLSPGGGFQAGVIAASFFICRYMIYDIYDIPIGKVIKLKKILFMGIILLAMFFLTFAAYLYMPKFRTIYLVLMNMLIGFKVTCGFVIMFIRFIAFERR
jgi:multicomponent Na+:H+ antiporter subunit B